MKLSQFLFGLLLLSVGQQVWADGPLLIKLFVDESASVTGDDAKHLKFMRGSREIKKAKVVLLDKAAFLANVVTFTTPDNLKINLNKMREERRSDTDMTWYGKTDTGGEAVFAVNDDKISGIVREKGKVYEVKYLNNGFHVLCEVDQALLPPEHPITHPSGGMRE